MTRAADSRKRTDAMGKPSKLADTRKIELKKDCNALIAGIEKF